MPIKHAIWTVGEKPAPLALGREGSYASISRCLHQTANNWRGNAWSSGSTIGEELRSISRLLLRNRLARRIAVRWVRDRAGEQQLEAMIVADPRMLSPEWAMGCRLILPHE